MVGFGAGRFVVLARQWRSLILESGSVHSVVLLTVGTLACRVIGVGPIGNGSLAVQVLGVLFVGGQGRGNGVQVGVVGQRSGGGGGFIGQGGVGSATERSTLVRPNWS